MLALVRTKASTPYTLGMKPHPASAIIALAFLLLACVAAATPPDSVSGCYQDPATGNLLRVVSNQAGYDMPTYWLETLSPGQAQFSAPIVARPPFELGPEIDHDENPFMIALVQTIQDGAARVFVLRDSTSPVQAANELRIRYEPGQAQPTMTHLPGRGSNSHRLFPHSRVESTTLRRIDFGSIYGPDAQWVINAYNGTFLLADSTEALLWRVTGQRGDSAQCAFWSHPSTAFARFFHSHPPGGRYIRAKIMAWDQWRYSFTVSDHYGYWDTRDTTPTPAMRGWYVPAQAGKPAHIVVERIDNGTQQVFWHRENAALNWPDCLFRR